MNKKFLDLGRKKVHFWRIFESCKKCSTLRVLKVKKINFRRKIIGKLWDSSLKSESKFYTHQMKMSLMGLKKNWNTSKLTSYLSTRCFRHNIFFWSFSTISSRFCASSRNSLIVVSNLYNRKNNIFPILDQSPCVGMYESAPLKNSKWKYWKIQIFVFGF